MTSSYHTLAAAVEFHEVIKGSNFIAYVSPAASLEAAQAVMQARQQQHSSANHNCWAYCLAEVYRFSDDGEPGGTAGRPMLEVLQKRELDRIVAVVTRYFGGTKLGAGGLIRAYSGTLAKALDQSEVIEIKPRSTLRLYAPFALMDTVHRLLADFAELETEAPSYDAQGLVLTLQLPSEARGQLAAALREHSRGEARLEDISEA